MHTRIHRSAHACAPYLHGSTERIARSVDIDKLDEPMSLRFDRRHLLIRYSILKSSAWLCNSSEDPAKSARSGACIFSYHFSNPPLASRYALHWYDAVCIKALRCVCVRLCLAKAAVYALSPCAEPAAPAIIALVRSALTEQAIRERLHVFANTSCLMSVGRA